MTVISKVITSHHNSHMYKLKLVFLVIVMDPNHWMNVQHLITKVSKQFLMRDSLMKVHKFLLFTCFPSGMCSHACIAQSWMQVWFFFRPQLNFLVWPQSGAIINCMTRPAPRPETQHWVKVEKWECMFACFAVFSPSALGKYKVLIPLQYFVALIASNTTHGACASQRHYSPSCPAGISS